MKYPQLFCTITILCILTGQLACGQETPKTLRINFSSTEVTGKDEIENLNPGDLFYVAIDSINLNLYKVLINKTDSTVVKPDSAGNLFANFDLESLTTLASSFSPIGGLIGAFVSRGNDKILVHEGDIQDLAVTKETPEAIDKEDAVSNVIETIEEAYVAFGEQLSELHELKKEYRKLVNTYTVSLLRYGMSLSNKEARKTPWAKLPDYGNIVDDFDKIYKDLTDLITANNNTFTEYTTQILPYSSVIYGVDSLRKSHEQIITYYEAQTKKLAEIEAKLDSSTYLPLLKSWIIGTNNSSNKFTSLPIQYSDQLNKLSIEIVPRNAEDRLQDYRTTLVFPSKEKEYFWGVSTGFYASSMTDEGYSLRSEISESDTLFSIVEEDPGSFELGVNAMFRYGRRFFCADSFGWHLGFGPGLSISESIRSRLMLGGGIYGGKKQKILLDAGIILGSVDRLSNLYREGDPLSEQPDRLTVSKTTVGAYVSLSYLFGL